MVLVYRLRWLAACCVLAGCITTGPINFEEEDNVPPCISSSPDASFPLNEIGDLNLDEPSSTQELPLQTIIVEANLEQVVQYRVFLDSPPPPFSDSPILDGNIAPNGFLAREATFSIPFSVLTPGTCHKVEVLVSGAFSGFVEPRRPLEPGDVHQATWWIRVVDQDQPIAGICN